MGNLLAMVIMELLHDAIVMLARTFPKATTKSQVLAVFHQLQLAQEMEDDHFVHTAKEYNNAIVHQAQEKIVNDEENSHVNASSLVETLFYSPATVCHSALLPSQARVTGILLGTKHDDNKDISNIDDKMGSHSRLDAVHNHGLSLTFDPELRHYEDTCTNVSLLTDYRDYFYLDASHGWSAVTLPNAAEQDEYLQRGESLLRGMVLLCFTECERNYCDGHALHNGDAICQGTWEVNGIAVTNVIGVLPCHLLQHDDNDNVVWPANAQGKYHISMRIHEKDAFVRISSFILL